MRLVAVPEQYVHGDGQGTSVTLSSFGPFEVVNERNLAALISSVEGGQRDVRDNDKIFVSRAALAVLLQYSNHVIKASLIGPTPDAGLVTATAKLNEEFGR